MHRHDPALIGAIDLHAHSDPDSYPRSWDGFEVAKLAKERGMRGLLLKNHWTETAGLAYTTREDATPGFEVFGGLSLDSPVGGVNPQAVRYIYTLGNYDSNGSQVIDDNVMWTISGKLSWQVNRSAQLSYFNNTQYKLIGHRSAGTFSDSRAAMQRQVSHCEPGEVQTSPLRSNMAIDVAYSRFRADDVFGSGDCLQKFVQK